MLMAMAYLLPFAAVGFIILLILASKGLITVSTGNAVVIEKLGKFSKILEPGMHLLIPGVDSVKAVTWSRIEEERQGNRTVIARKTYRLKHIPTNEQAQDLPDFSAVTKDRIQVTVNGIIFYKIVDIQKAVYGISDLYKAIENLVETAIRDFTTKTSFEEIFQVRDQMMTSVVGQLHECEVSWGIKVTRFDIQGIDCSKDIMKATENSVKQQREAEAELKLAEATKRAALLKLNKETELQMAKKDAHIAAAKLEKQAHNELQMIQLQSELEQTRAKHQQIIEEAQTEKEKALLLAQKDIEKTKLELNVALEHWKAMLASTSDAELLKTKILCDTWMQIASNPNSNLLLPMDIMKHLGTASIFKDLVATKVE